MHRLLPWVLLAACTDREGTPDPSDTDASDTATCSGMPDIIDFGMDCTADLCTLFVDVENPSGALEFWITHTGDPGSSCLDGSYNECGVWEEVHNEFADVETTGCLTRKELTLSIVGDPDQQRENESTLFTASIADQLTRLVLLNDAAGGVADCDVAGEDVGYFAALCSL